VGEKREKEKWGALRRNFPPFSLKEERGKEGRKSFSGCEVHRGKTSFRPSPKTEEDKGSGKKRKNKDSILSDKKVIRGRGQQGEEKQEDASKKTRVGETTFGGVEEEKSEKRRLVEYGLCRWRTKKIADGVAGKRR